jgi:hypothetical protein
MAVRMVASVSHAMHPTTNGVDSMTAESLGEMSSKRRVMLVAVGNRIESPRVWQSIRLLRSVAVLGQGLLEAKGRLSKDLSRLE